MAQIIERLTMRPTSPPLNRYVTIQRRMKLLQIVPASHERVRLRFENRKGDTANRYAHRLILALPKRSLEHLVSSLPTVANEIEAVFGFPLIKCFFVVDRPWWSADRGANEFATVVPTRELHWWRTDDGTRGLVMVYADRPAAHFWADYLPRPQEQLKAKVWKSMKQAKRLAEKFRQYVYANGVKRSKYSDENLVACAIRDWSREPFGGGAHAWRPGRKSWEVMRRLKQFALVDGGVRNVHICGEAYSDYQGFIEGSLRSADNVLKVLRIRR